jgi:hypothetical protein
MKGTLKGCDMTTNYQVMMYTRLKPHTKWTGGRITAIDTVTLEDAARFASKHAGVEILPADFLRAAARGEILLRACCPRAVTMLPCFEADKPLPIAENSLPTLPLAACKALSNGRPAMWRTYEEIEVMEAFFGKERCRFARWELPENEPDLITKVDDCRVTGRDVHALADAYTEAPTQNTEAPGAVVNVGVSIAQPKQRAQEIRILELLKSNGYDPLKLAQRTPGKPGPKAEIRSLALTDQTLFTQNSFNKAWERLRSDDSVTGAE